MSQNRLGETLATTTDMTTEQALLPKECGAQMRLVSNIFFT